MKLVLMLLGLLLMAATAHAWAGSPEEAYMAARDAYIKKFKAIDDAGPISDVAMQEHDRARADLEQQLRGIIGPLTIKGLPANATFNISTLFPSDQGFGTLDALVYASADNKTRVIVTTESMFSIWLRAHKDWWGDKVANVPQTTSEALTSEAFYTQALQTDAAVMKFAPLPLRTPAGASFAFAMLAARSQDNSPPAPSEIILSLVQGGRLYVVSAALQRTFPVNPACEKIRREQETNTDDMAAREQADTAFRRCFAAAAPKQAAFALAEQQARALLDRLPLR